MGTRQMDDTCSWIWARFMADRQTDSEGKAALVWDQYGSRRSKVTKMTKRSELRASPNLRGRHVFLIEPQWSRGSLILISGDRNPIFRGDS